MNDQNGLWTVLIYIAAANELTRNADQSLEAIKLGGSSAFVRTVIQIDRSGDSGATRYVGEKGTFSSGEEIGSIDTGNPKPLIEFLRWGMSRCPAEHYLLVLWGHGAGLDQRTPGFTSGDSSAECLSVQSQGISALWPNQALSETVAPPILEILHDYETRHYLSNGCLRFALEKTGQTVDILGLDACLMGMAEIICEFRNSVHFAVTSEDTEPKASWPYTKIISSLVGNPTIDPRDLGELIVKDYLTAFPAAERRQGLTLSVCDLSKSSNLMKTVRNLSRELCKFVPLKGRSAINRARAIAPRYDRDYVDLLGFCQALVSQLDESADSEVVKDAKAVIAVLKQDFVVYSENVGRGVSHSNGISIFFPDDNGATRNRSSRARSVRKMPKHSRNSTAGALKPVALIQSSYKTLAFVRETGWDKFLLTYLGEKQKPVSRLSMRGENMTRELESDRNGRKKPSSPRKKPSSPRKKPSSPRPKPSSPRKKPRHPRANFATREQSLRIQKQNLMAQEQNLIAREQNLIAREKILMAREQNLLAREEEK
jgi:hypothetical protein